MSLSGSAGFETKTFYDKWSAGIVALTLLCLPFAIYAAGLAVVSNVNRVEDWLPKSFSETKNLAWFRQHFASDQFIVISWEGCQLGSLDDPTSDDPRLAKLARLLAPGAASAAPDSLELGTQDLDAQDLDASSADPSEALTPADAADVARYFKAVVTGRQLVDKLAAPPLNLPPAQAAARLQGTMIGPDGRQTCLVLTLHDAALSKLKQVLGTGQDLIFRPDVPPGLLRRLTAQAGIPAADLHVGGPPVDNSAIDEEGERTLVRLAGLSGLLGLGLAWWSLRSVLLTGIVFLCGVMSAATSLGIVWLTGQNVDAILMSMPSLVYVLAISGAVHLVNYYREAIQEAGHLHGAAERAVRHAWRPAVLCSVTTAIGLLSLVASELVPIRKFGVYSAAGVMSLVVIVYFFLPAALHLSRVGRRWLASSTAANQPTPTARQQPASRRWEAVARGIVAHYRAVGLACAAVTLLVGLGLRNTNSSIDLLKLFDRQARILQDYRWLEEHLGMLVPLEIVVRFPVPTQLENQADQAQVDDWTALSFLQRLETVTRMQLLIERNFGPDGAGLVGRSMSAASFAPSLPSANTGNMSFIHRKAIDARLSRSKQELGEAGFLKVDAADGSELWRISLRVAAFRDVDYGQFVKQLEGITQPLLDAYHARSKILSELARWEPDHSPSGKRVLLWGYTNHSGPEKLTHETFQLVLHRLLHENQCKVSVLAEAPQLLPLSQIEALSGADAVVLFGDFSDSDLEMVRSGVPRVFDARLQGSAAAAGEQSLVGLSETQVDAIYTGVVPIVYQAQRALLNSLIESTWWSFLTITPIMMLVSRSILAGSVAMIPNLVPIILIFGGMGWLGVPVDIGSMMTASIALGVAVDDTIHFLARYREELARHSLRGSAIVATYGHCAVPTLQAALISGLGLSVFAFSTFTPTQRFGWLMLFILMAGVVSELVLLPALLASPVGRVFTIPAPPPEDGTGGVRRLRFDPVHFQFRFRRKRRRDCSNQHVA